MQKEGSKQQQMPKKMFQMSIADLKEEGEGVEQFQQ